MRPAVHDGDAVRHLGDDAEVVRDEQQRQVELAPQVAKQIENLRLHRDVERRGRLVGNHSAGSAASASAIIARWRRPPLS